MQNEEHNGDLDPELLVAFRYFDRNNTGFIRTDDLESILHGLGVALSRGYVQDIVAASCDSREASRIFYASIIRVIDATKKQPAATAPTSTIEQPVVSQNNVSSPPPQPVVATTSSESAVSRPAPMLHDSSPVEEQEGETDSLILDENQE